MDICLFISKAAVLYAAIAYVKSPASYYRKTNLLRLIQDPLGKIR